MIIVYSYVPVVEEILVQRLSKYFKETIKWDELYSNFPHIRINNEYPWVPYVTDESLYTSSGIDLNKVNETLFPSVTVVNSNDIKSPELFIDMNKTGLEKADLPAFIAQAAEEGYEISPSDLAAVTTFFDTNNILHGINIVQQRRDTINIDITTDDETSIKNRIFSFIELFLVGQEALDLKTDLDIEIITPTVSGGRSGIYNIDFGRTLRGSTIQFEVDYKISQCMYNTEAGLITNVVIDHTVSGG